MSAMPHARVLAGWRRVLCSWNVMNAHGNMLLCTSTLPCCCERVLRSLHSGIYVKLHAALLGLLTLQQLRVAVLKTASLWVIM